MKKRLFSALLCCVMLMTLMPVQVLAEAVNTTSRGQSGLKEGETYYFDLSGIRHTEFSGYYPEYRVASDQIPGGTLDYVPFTFIGKIDAYVLNQNAYREQYVSFGAGETRDPKAPYGYTYEHNLFLANCAVLLPPEYEAVDGGKDFFNGERDVTWKGLLYGQFFESGGALYSVRAPSVGAPKNNEWEQILAKDESLLRGSEAEKNFSYVGQECYKTITGSVDRNTRTWVKSRETWELNRAWNSERTNCWRPVIEPAQNVDVDDLRAVTLDLCGGSLGDVTGEIKLVALKGSELTLPRKGGLKSPSGRTTYLRWVDVDTGKNYAPGGKIPASVNRLRADWANEEHFTLETGKTYYFDLSTDNLTNVSEWEYPEIPGEINENLPDKTLHYVPFTYAGTIGAYSNTETLNTFATDEWAEKFINKHSLFVAEHNITNKVTWDTLRDRGLIFDCYYECGGFSYIMRAPTGGSKRQDQEPYECEFPINNEWDVLIDKDPENIKNWKKISSYMQEYSYALSGDGTPITVFRTTRGVGNPRGMSNVSHDRISTLFLEGYRPVLEPRLEGDGNVDALQEVTLCLGDGKLGGSSKDISIVVANGKSFSAPSQVGLTRPEGDEDGTHFFWIDASGQRYRPGDKVPAGTKRLTAEWRVREYYDLEMGGTYYFDLSEAGIPGKVNGDLPDTTLHYVPFTNAGTVEAHYYDLWGDKREEAHNLFIADYNVTNEVSWNALSDAGLILGAKNSFGQVNYQFEGISYALRAPSAGDTGGESMITPSLEIIEPTDNEWNVIQRKCSIKNREKYKSWGQFFSSARGISERRDDEGNLEYTQTWFFWPGGNYQASDLGYRPVLQLLNIDSIGTRETESVTLYLNGGKLGTSNETKLKIATASGAGFTAPAREGLTPPNGKQDGSFVWLGNDGFYYLPGMTVSSEASTLTAQWDTTTYNVTYRISDGSGSEYTVRHAAKAHDVPLTLKGALYGREGYEQVGWATEDGGEKVYELGGKYTENTDVTLYPVWEKKHTHSYGAWSMDDTHHWHECTDPECPKRADSIKDRAQHTYGESNKCEICEHEKPVHTHDLTLVPAKAATCTETGNKAYYICSGCDDWFEDENGENKIADKSSVILATTGHKAVGEWQSDEDGHYKHCVCGMVMNRAEHTVSDWIIDKAASAADNGEKHKECTVCKRVLETETIPATGYTVTFDACGGLGTMQSAIVESGSRYILPDCAFSAPNGKEFKAWSVGGVEYSPGDSITVSGDITVLALWKDKQVMPPVHTHDLTLVPAKAATCTETGNKAYYICSGCDDWFEDENGENKIADKSSVILATTGHKAVGEWQSDEDGHYKYCACGMVMNRAEHTASDWIIDKAASAADNGEKHKECIVCKRVLETETIPATGYTVTFDACNGTLSDKTTLMTGSDGKLTRLPTPVRDGGYIFDGWYTEKIGGMMITTDTIFSKDTTVYAHWIYIGGGDDNPPVMYCTLRFETNGGRSIPSVEETYNTYIDLAKYVPSRSGYTFIGWYGERGLLNKVSGVYLTGDMTVYAGWRMDEYPQSDESPFADVSEDDWFCDDVSFVYENELMLGTSKALFSPYGTATRAMIATVIWRIEGSPAPKDGNGFADVEAEKWYTDAVTWTAESGIFDGYGDGEFKPNTPITREQLAAVLYRYASYKGFDVRGKGSLDGFSDSNAISEWAQNAVQWAVGSGLINGKTDNTLDLRSTATRAEIAAILRRFGEKFGM